MKQRVAYFDQMKGLAIILVVIGHLTQFAFGLQGSDVNRWLEIFHMPIFFYISGYFAYKVLGSPEEVLKQSLNKVRTIAIPLIVWCALWTMAHDGESFLQMLSRCGGRYWFLYTLAILSLFFIAYEQLVKCIKNPYLYVASWLIPFGILILIKLSRGG